MLGLRAGAGQGDRDGPGPGPQLSGDCQKSASCEAEGSVTYTCSRCGDSYTVEIPGISHPDPNTLTFTMPAADVKVFAEATELNYNQNMVFICDMDGGTVEADRTIAAWDENMPGSLVLNVNSVQQTLPCTAAADDKVDLIYTAPKLCTLHALKYQCTISGTLRTISLSFTLQDDGTYTASFSMRGSDVTIFAEIEKNSAVIIRGVSGSFNDKIKLNFYFDLPEDVAADEEAYVTLTNENAE